ncbi:protein containing Cadherin domains [Rhodopirellula baltica WH47]|uniref:Protein containing Cadherin domains n=1 Tax=Rhodopirellula baltica WH47 TaxID=991778 RepID=F2AN01_RHOBT|nr:protein containing Cadherin domains [Rhodopirellula baltica WH47]
MISVTIDPINDAPVAVDDNVSTNQNTTLAIDMGANDTDVDGVSLSVTQIDGSSMISTSYSLANGDLVRTGPTSFNFVPDTDFVGIQTFTYTLDDGAGGTDTATVTINVIGPGPSNTLPEAADDEFTIDEDEVLSGNLIDGTGTGADAGNGPDVDVDGDILTAVKLTNPTKGTVDLLADGSFTYTPFANANDNSAPTGPDTFTYRLLDGRGGTDVGTVTINVTPENDAPVLNDATFIVAENAPVNGVVGTVTASDPDSTVTYSITAGNGADRFEINAANGQIKVKNLLDFEIANAYSLTVQASDGTLTDTATVNIVVTNVNDAPIIAAQGFTITENVNVGTVVGTVVASDQDAGQSLTYSITAGNELSDFVIDPSTGQITTAGEIDYEEMAAGFDSSNHKYDLTVTVTDNANPTASTSATVTINVNDVTDESGPRVTAIRVNSTAWAPEFRDFVDYDESVDPMTDPLLSYRFNDSQDAGYEIPDGTEQLATLPWVGLNQIIVDFDKDVSSSLDLSDFVLNVTAGVRADSSTASIPRIDSMTSEATTSGLRVTLTLNQSIEPSILSLFIEDSGISDSDGNILNGEWVNGVTVGDSGDTTNGGDFSYEFRVLPGDVVKSGGSFELVDGNDVSYINANIGGVIVPGVGASMDPFANINGDLEITGADRGGAEVRSGSRLISPPMPLMSLVSGSFFVMLDSNSIDTELSAVEAKKVAIDMVLSDDAEEAAFELTEASEESNEGTIQRDLKGYELSVDEVFASDLE